MSSHLVKALEGLPAAPGVYLFYGSERYPLYIGKAKNLKARVRSYFQRGTSPRGTKFGLRDEIRRVKHEVLPSETAALIREALLIKRYRPKYNVLMRDDKNYFYVGLTHEVFPRIFLTHQPVKDQRSGVQSQFVGPFTSGRALKVTLGTLRRILPFCTCKRLHRGSCLSANLRLCPGWCCQEGRNVGANERRAYRAAIRRVYLVLQGRSKAVTKMLKQEMRRNARKERFEEAARARDALRSLENIFSHREMLQSPGGGTKETGRALAELLGVSRPIQRIEGYDIADIRGTAASGSMVVFVGDKPAKTDYRKFRIKTVRGANDPAMLAEVLRRRVGHREWHAPDLVLLDGGKGQLSRVMAKLISYYGRRDIPFLIVALAKRSRSLYVPGWKEPLALASMPQAISRLLEQVRDEAHRFARVYHHWMRDQEIISE